MRLRQTIARWLQTPLDVLAGRDTSRSPVTIRGRDRIMEALEDRLMFSMNPTGMEQEMLEMINRFRMTPTNELEQIFISTQPGDPNYFRTHDPGVNAAMDFFAVNPSVLASQFQNLNPAAPLAWNAALINAAYTHSNLMIQHDTQAHVLPGEQGLLDRIVAAGYNWTGSVSVSENVFAYAENVFHGHAAFVIDWGTSPTGIQTPPGHRENILNPNLKEVGIAMIPESNPATSVGPYVVTQDFGTRGNYGNARVLGVVYADTNSNDFYNAGEGLGGVTITISNTGSTYTTTTMSAGGYQIDVAPGTYDVMASGGSLLNPIYMGSVVVGAANVKLDLNTAIVPSTGSIAGQVFHDGNQNGALNVGELGLAGWTVFVDQNGDGILNAGERSAVTNASGQYTLFDIAPGSATLRIEAQSYYRATTSVTQQVNVAAGGVVSDVRFGQFQWVTVNGTQATITGTPGNDVFSWVAGSSTFTLNGNHTNLAAHVTSLAFNGLGGTNTLTLTGSPGDDQVKVQNRQLTMTGAGYSVTGVDFANFEVFNGGLAGTDRADLYDTPGADTFRAYPGMSVLTGSGLTTRVHGFDVVYAYSTLGGADAAHLYDGIGPDVLVAGSNYALLKNTGGGFFYYAYKFPTVHAYATAGGYDAATLYDSPGNDQFVATPTLATMGNGSTYNNNAHGFDAVYAFATAGGTNDAYLYDGPTNDRFVGRPEFGSLRDSAGSFLNYAAGFNRVLAFATAGGDDQATLYDGPSDDQYVGRPDYALLRGKQYEFSNYAQGFHRTFAYSTAGGQDGANLYDSAGNDVFTARPDHAFMQSTTGSYYNRVNGFKQVLGFSTLGGADIANLYDSAGDDVFTGYPAFAVMRDQLYTYYNYAHGFSRVNAFAQNGGFDTANLFGSQNDDRFVSGPTYAMLLGLGGGYYNYTTGFDRVYATAGSGGVDYATLYDSEGDDTLTSHWNYSELQNAAASYYIRVNGFGGVYAFASSGNNVAHLYDSPGADLAYGRNNVMRMSGTNYFNRAAGFGTVNIYGNNGGQNTLDVEAVDYVLEVLGTWH